MLRIYGAGCVCTCWCGARRSIQEAELYSDVVLAILRSRLPEGGVLHPLHAEDGDETHQREGGGYLWG